MGIFTRLFQAKEPGRIVEPSHRGDHTWQIEVVGESHYQAALAKIAGPKRPGLVLWKWADLVPDPKSKYDPNAVKVMVEGLQVGHLAAIEAPIFNGLLKQNALTSLRVKADITSDWQTARGDEYGVVLHVPREYAKPMKDALFRHQPEF